MDSLSGRELGSRYYDISKQEEKNQNRTASGKAHIFTEILHLTDGGLL